MPDAFNEILGYLSKSPKGTKIANQPHLQQVTVTTKVGRSAHRWKRIPGAAPPLLRDQTHKLEHQYQDRVSFEVVPGEGAPSNAYQPSNLTYEQSLQITEKVVSKIRKALDLTGVPVIGISTGPGGWESDPVNPSPQAELRGPKAKVRQVAALMGLLAEQTGMFVTTPSKDGAGQGIAVYEKGTKKFSDPDTVSKFWDAVRREEPRIGHGFMPVNHNGCAGIAMVNTYDYTHAERWTDKDFQRFERAIEKVAKECGITLNPILTGSFQVDADFILNDWNNDSGGEYYRKIIDGEDGVSPLLPSSMIDNLLGEVQEVRRQAIQELGLAKAVANIQGNIHYEDVGGKKKRMLGKKMEQAPAPKPLAPIEAQSVQKPVAEKPAPKKSGMHKVPENKFDSFSDKFGKDFFKTGDKDSAKPVEAKVEPKQEAPKKEAPATIAPSLPKAPDMAGESYAEKHLFTPERSKKNLEALMVKLEKICEEQEIEHETFENGLTWARSIVDRAFIISHAMKNLSTVNHMITEGEIVPHNEVSKLIAKKNGVDPSEYIDARNAYQKKVVDTLSSDEGWQNDVDEDGNPTGGSSLSSKSNEVLSHKSPEKARFIQARRAIENKMETSNTSEDSPGIGLDNFTYANMLPDPENIGLYGDVNVVLHPEVIGHENVFATPWEAVQKSDYMRQEGHLYVNHIFHNGDVKEAWTHLAAMYYGMAAKAGYDPANASSTFEAMESTFLNAAEADAMDIAAENDIPEPMDMFDWEVKIKGKITRDMIHKILVLEDDNEENPQEKYEAIKPLADEHGIKVESMESYLPMFDEAEDTLKDAKKSMSEILEEALRGKVEKSVVKKKSDYEYASTQFNLPEDMSRKIVRWTRFEVPQKNLTPKGIEKESHITIRYGLVTDNLNTVKSAVDGFEGISVTLGEVDIFDTNSDFDVLIIKCESPMLYKLNEAISSGVKCIESNKPYRPHITLAYVKKGAADHLIGRKDFKGKKVSFEKFILSSKNRTQTPIFLSKRGRGSMSKAVRNIRNLIHYDLVGDKRVRSYGKKPGTQKGEGERAVALNRGRQTLKVLAQPTDTDNSNDFPTDFNTQSWMKWSATADKPSRLLPYLKNAGRIHLHPEIEALCGVPQESQWHPEGDAFVHTGYVMNSAAEIAKRDKLTPRERSILVLSALCHDFGKAVKTRYTESHGKVYISSAGHEKASGPLARTFLNRIGVDQDLIEQIIPIVENHMAHVDYLHGANEKSVQRLARRLSPGSVEMLSKLMEADMSGRPPLPKGMPPGGVKMVALAHKTGVFKHAGAKSKLEQDFHDSIEEMKKQSLNGWGYCGDVADAVYHNLLRRGYSAVKGPNAPKDNEVSKPYTDGHQFIRVGNKILDAWDESGELRPQIMDVNDPKVKSDPDYNHWFDDDNH